MNGSLLNKILQLECKHALYCEDGKWYHNLKEFPGVLFDKHGYIIFQTKDKYTNHPDLQIKKDLHIKDGIESLSDYIKFYEFQEKIINGFFYQKEEGFNEETVRVKKELHLILRKQSLVDKIKKSYNNTCQICGIKINISKKKAYSEVHHIIPLGKPHNGKDSLDNLICVCPNHHIQLDYFSIIIDIDSLKLVKHKISEASVTYHNERVNNIKTQTN